MSINLLNEVVMEIKNEAGQVFRAHFPNGVSLQECFEALRTFAEKIVAMGQENEQKAKEAENTQPTMPEQPQASPEVQHGS